MKMKMSVSKAGDMEKSVIKVKLKATNILILSNADFKVI